MSIIFVLAAIAAIVATILAFIFIVPEKKRASLNRFGKFLHDTVNFKYLIIEKILQGLYILATAFVILVGFFMLFYVQEGYRGYYYSTPDRWYGGYGLLLMLLGPIVIRITYEFIMMVIMLIKNVIQINNKLKTDSQEQADIFAAPSADSYSSAAKTTNAPAAAPAQPVHHTFCIHCGARLNLDGTCPSCGSQKN